jgi:hypothetical protein
VGDALLQDLWFRPTDGVVIDGIDTDDELDLIRARAQEVQAGCPSCGVL